MNRLGMTWYGQLLDALGAEGLRMPQLPAATIRTMVSKIEGVLSAAKGVDA